MNVFIQIVLKRILEKVVLFFIKGSVKRKMKVKFRMAILINLIMLAMVLTACGSGTEDVSMVPDVSDVSEISADIAEGADSDAADEISSEPEILDVLSFVPETCEDYIKLADTYLQSDDVLQALAVLDEGIEKLSTGEQSAVGQDVDLLSQRKEYVFGGMVAVATGGTTNRYDENGSILLESEWEGDENGNKISDKTMNYDNRRGSSYLSENRYDGNGNKIEFKYTYYDSDGNSSLSSHVTWAYDKDGNEIEWAADVKVTNSKERREREYDANGKLIKEINYDNDELAGWIETEYDVFGNKIRYEEYDKNRKCTYKKVYKYDEHGNLNYDIEYEYGNISKAYECEYDENGNIIKSVDYDGDGNITRIYERKYDEMGREIKFVHYNGDGTVNSSDEYEYDGNGNEIKSVHYDGEGNIRWMSESEYDENGREIYYSHKSDGVVTNVRKNEYGEDGSVLREVVTYYSDTGQKWYEKICEYSYDEKGNLIKYDFTDYEKGETTSLSWEREYDEDGRGTDFYFYDNEKAVSYQSESGYDENGRIINYTGYDKNGSVLVRREIEYDTSGNVIRENYYDADDNLIQYYENEYDDFGSVTRQIMYENGIFKSEKQTSYAYHYIGNIDGEAADYMDIDMTPEEYNLKQREIFIRFLNGEEKVRYYRDEDDVKDGKIVEETITDLIDFEYIGRQYEETQEYTFLDMTGDGIEELVILFGGKIERLCVIQCSYGALKVIHDIEWGRFDVYLVKCNGMTGICRDYSMETGERVDRNYYYFLDGKGKKEIVLEKWRDDPSYNVNDSDSFEERDISKGEYYDIMGGMVEKVDIDWQELEEPDK